MRVGVIGASGQFGQDILTVLNQTQRYEVIPFTHEDIDITQAEQVYQKLTEGKFDAIVNSAAYVRVDDCEDRADIAFDINAIGALNVARACRDTNALCIYISTDYVFSGDRPHPYTEEDVPNPINVYGVSKLSGEFLVRQTAPQYLILRLAGVFGKAGARGKGGNFIETILKKAYAGEPLKVVDDMFMSPTYTHDAARLLDRLLLENVTGVIHGANVGICTWFEFAVKALQLVGLSVQIEAVSTDAFPTKAKRPPNSALTSTRLDRAAPHFVMPLWQDALAAYLREKGYCP